MEAVSNGPVPELHTDSEEEEPEEAEELIEPGIVSLQLALFQHLQRSEPLPVFLSA